MPAAARKTPCRLFWLCLFWASIPPAIGNETVSTDISIDEAYQLAMHGDVGAQYFLFKSYRSGIGVERSIPNAVRWLTSAAYSGHPEAQFWLGHISFFGNGVERDVDTGVDMITKSAQQDYLPAQVRLGQIYNGWRYRFYPSDQQKALYWYSKAADQGDIQSMYILGCMNYFGLRHSLDTETGMAWFNKAEHAGDDTANALIKMNNEEELRVFCERVIKL
jgi:TPR repeat protein